MLARWSGGQLRATPHRVKPPPPGAPARVSVPFFFEPNFDAVIRPLSVKACEAHRGSAAAAATGSPNDGPSAGDFPPVKYGDHLLRKVAGNFDLK